MTKTKLSLDELRVETFEVEAAGDARGTVLANEGCVTQSCGGTCGADLSTAAKYDATVTNCPDCCY